MNQPHQPKKRFGQNFLRDPFVITQIIHAIDPQSDDHVVEIGPGDGALTREIIRGVKQYDAIEIDRHLVPKINQQFGKHENFTCHQADVLKFDFEIFAPNKLRVVGNLPYNISTPLLFKLFEYRELITDIHVMLQKEVADRLAALHGNKQYGRLSVMSQAYCKVEKLFDIANTAFEPQPKVTSSMVRLTPQKTYAHVNYKTLNGIVTLAFNQRRKTIQNALKSQFSAEQLHKAQIDPKLRPEQLSLKQFVHLADLSEG